MLVVFLRTFRRGRPPTTSLPINVIILNFNAMFIDPTYDVVCIYAFFRPSLPITVII
jgi:hypothetical protein